MLEWFNDEVVRSTRVGAAESGSSESEKSMNSSVHSCPMARVTSASPTLENRSNSLIQLNNISREYQAVPVVGGVSQ